MGILLLVFTPAMLVVVSVMFAFVLDRPSFAAIRDALARSKYKPLTLAIPFGPAITLLLMERAPKPLPVAILDVAGVLGIFAGSIGGAAFAACLFCLPEDTARRGRMIYVPLLAITLWTMDVIVIILLHDLLH